MPYKDKTSEIARRKACEATKRWRDKNREKQREGDRKRRQKKKKALIDHLGGKCVGCGTTENLQFDHIDRTTKTYSSIQGQLNRSLDVLIEEANKCQLLCRNCHITKSRVNYDHEELLKGYDLQSITKEGNRITIVYELY